MLNAGKYTIVRGHGDAIGVYSPERVEVRVGIAEYIYIRIFILL